MNKHLYRILFNQARGQLMVVAEIARSGRESGRRVRPGQKTALRSCRLSPLSCALLAVFGSVTVINSAQADIVADAQAAKGQQPNVMVSANGTPQVNIQTPSDAGVSRNSYSQFDVDQKGAILNNSHSNTSTSLGGMVQGNPWLAKGEARIIINEVNSRDPSQLNVHIEVAGQKAQVVIANPSGISCNGCGFINANRATLTTGQVQMNNGQLTGFDVDRGEIVIQGAGMNSLKQDYTDIIARSVKINAEIDAQDLNITTGRNHVDAGHQQIDKKSSDGSTRPQLALDVSQLGGMYANKIRLIGTEDGVGVHNAGSIGAQAGSLVVTADGHLENSGKISSKGDMALTSNAAINNSGEMLAEGNASLTTAGDLHNSGSITSRHHLQTQSATLNSEQGSVLAAGVQQDGKLGGSGNLTLNASGQLRAQGQNLASGDIIARSQGMNISHSQTGAQNMVLDAGQGDLLTGSGAQVEAQQQLTANSRQWLNNDGGKLSANQLIINVHDLSNQQGALEQLGGEALQLNPQGTLNNQGGSIASNGKDLSISAARINNQGGKIIHAAQGNLTLTADSLQGEKGQILSAGHLIANSGETLLDAGVMSAQQITLHANRLSNRDGKILQTGSDLMTLDVFDDINNQQGVLAAGGSIRVDAASLNNQLGQVSSQNNGSLDVHVNDVLNNQQGFIGAGGDATLTTSTFNNVNGTLASEGGLSLTGAQITNQQGLVQAGQNLTVDTRNQIFDNTTGTVSAGKTLTLLTGALLNQAGQVLSAGDLRLNTHGQNLNNAQGNIAAAGDAQLDIASLNNRGGQLQAAGHAVINAFNGLVDNTTGLIRSGSTVGVNAGQIINRDTKADNMGLEGQSVSLNSDLLDNAGGALRANDLLDITTGKSLNNTQGLLSSGERLNVWGGNSLVFSNTGGTLIAGKNLQLMASSLSGDGSVLSQDAMTLALQQAFFNQGEVIANGNMNLNVSQGLENSQLIKAGGVLNLHAASLINNQNGENSAGQNHLLIDSDLTIRGLLDGILTHIQSATLNNIGSGRIYGDHIALQTGTLNNLAENGTAATIAARDRLDIGAQTLNNLDHGLIFSAGDVAVGGQLTGQWVATGQAAVLNNHSATLESTGGMALNISQINNVNDHLVTQDVVTEQSQHHEAVLKGATTRYDWADVDTSSKNKYGVHDAKMPDGSVNNNFYEYNYQRTITETQIKESEPGQIIAGGNLIINSNQLNNDDSRIMAGGTLGGEPGEVHNEATKGSKVTVDVGKQTRWYAKKSGGGLGGKKTSQGKDTSNYQPTPVVQTLDLQAMVYQGNTQIDGSGAVVGRRDTSTLSQQAGNAGAIDSNTAQRPITPPAGQIFEVVSSASAADTVIRISSPNTRLPDNSQFQLHPDFTSHYLVETDPRFTNQKQWLGSDYMQNAFTQSSDSVLKRLGDGYYEQRLIREQVVSLTGQRYLAGYDNDTDQYKALMDAGIAFGKNYTLTLGVALTPAQMALLTSDMVWLVKQDVTLPDGSVQSVLVPQVYARVKQGDLEGSGALLAGNNVALKTTHDLTNSGAILGREVTQLSADTLTNSGFIGGNRVRLNARIDINNLGGTLQGGDSLVAIAGRDINSSSTLRGSDDNRYLDRPAGIYVQNEGGTLGLQALNNINLTATQVSNIGTDSQTQIIAGNDLNLNTLSTTHAENGDWDKNNYRHLTQQEDVGSQINGGGSVALSAGHDLNARAASVTAKDALTAVAGNDINLTSGDSAYHLTEHSKQTSKGMLSGKTVETHDEVQNQRALGSNISGDSVTMQAGHNLSVSGSSVAGTNNVSLAAGNDLILTAADQSRQETHQYQEKKTGLSGTGGIGVSYGNNSLKTTDDGQSLTSAGSTVGSTQGNVTLNAGNTLTVKGSDVLAGKDINLTGKEVNILAADNQSVQTHTVEQKQSGLTLALSGAVGSAISTAVSSANDASTASTGRLAALDGMKSALGGVQAYQGYQLGDAQGEDPESLFGINLSYGSQSSKSEQKQTSNQSQGSTLTAGNNLNIHATDTDINVQGSQLQAGKDIGLMANRDVNLWSGVNTSVLDGSNESHGSSVGVGLNLGQGKKGLKINVSGDKVKGSRSGNGVARPETTVNAGNHLNIVSGRDTTLTGAQVTGEKVTLDVGRNLTLTSEQDSDNYDSKQQNASAGVSGGLGSFSASANLSQDKMHSNYDSVQEQTGIFAGKGGFDIRVGEHTQLNGTVIGSTATADKNKLDTGTLGFSDIENKADYKVEHQSIGLSTGGGDMGGQFVGNMANSLLVGVNGEGHDSSTTKSAVSDGSIIIRDKDKQTQNVNDLSRDVEHANQTLSPIFDKEKEQQRLQEAQKIGEIGSQVSDIIRTQGAIEATKAAKEKMEHVTPEERADAKAKWQAAHPGEPVTDKDIDGQVYQTAYDKAFNASDYGTGGKFQQAAQAATAAIQGLAGGDLAKAIAGGSAPYLANIIAKTTEDGPERLMAHAVVNAVLASVQGNSAIAGAAGAVTAEVMAGIARDMYGKPVSELSEEQKQTISALSTLAAGLAGGLTGDSSADTVAGAQAGKTTVENNYLSADQGLAFDKEMQSCKASGGDCSAVVDKWKKVSDEQSATLDPKCAENPLLCQNIDKPIIEMGLEVAQRPEWIGNLPGVDVMTDEQAKIYVQYWNAQDLEKIDVNSPAWTKFATFISDPENQAAVASLGVLGKDLVLIAKNSFTTKSLFKEMTAQGIKYTPENIVSAAKDSSGKIIFLEKGSSKAGLQHIVEEHGSQFAQIGVSEARIPDVVMKAVTDGKIVGYQGAGTGRQIYETVINGKKYNIAVTVGNNGYIVGANLRGSVK